MDFFLKEIANGNMAIIAGSIAFMFLMHKQAMAKLDAIVASNIEIKQVLAVHSEKLEQNTIKFIELNEHQKVQDEKIQKLDKDLHDAKNKIIRKDLIDMMIDNKIQKAR